MVAKSFPPKQVPTKNFHQIFLVETFLWSESHFLENRFLPKIINFFWSKIFYGRKIISSKTGSYLKVLLKLFWSKICMDAKSCPRQQVPTNNFHEICFVENVLWSQNHFLGNKFLYKISREKLEPELSWFSCQFMFKSPS
jgi:hypothetical protein